MEERESAAREHASEQDCDRNNVTPPDGGCSSDGVAHYKWPLQMDIWSTVQI